MDEDTNRSGRIDIDDLKWDYLKGDGDFRSDEVKTLRDEADIIVTNPPFSLFREFLSWIVESNKRFAIIGNQNAITYKEVFPLIKENKMWLGATGFSNDMVFGVPKGTEVSNAYKQKAERLGYTGDYTRMGNTCWFTSLEHGRRHTPLKLMTIRDNIKFSKHKEIRGIGYHRYDNYDAINVPYTDAIPSDYFPNSHLTGKIGHATLLTEQNGRVAESWECQSASSTSTAQNNLNSLVSRTMERTANMTCSRQPLRDVESSSVSSSSIGGNGVMGVPISFLDKYCPEQFEIVGASESEGRGFANGLWFADSGVSQPLVNGKKTYKRLFIRRCV